MNDPFMLREKALELADSVTAMRRDLHSFPEAAFSEYRTASIVARELLQLGWTVTMGANAMRPNARLGAPSPEDCARERMRAVAEGADAALVRHMGDGLTGLWADLACPDEEACENAPAVALRFDMDGLEVHECSGKEHLPAREGFVSRRANFMHACGHDGHVALGIGLARLLTPLRSRLRGTVRLIFQPAEETGTGACPMAEAGALDGIDRLIGLHLSMQASHSGDIICGTEEFLATTTFILKFHGRTAHAGMAPQDGHNALLAAASAVQNMHAISRHSAGSSRINIGQFHAGDATNIIAGEAWLSGETRGTTDEVNSYVMSEVERMAHAAAAMWGCTCTIIRTGDCPSAASSPELAAMVGEEASAMKRFRNIIPTAAFCASEDFTWLMNKVQKRGGQAVYMQLGADRAGGHHTGHFDFDEGVFADGLELLARMTLRSLSAEKLIF